MTSYADLKLAIERGAVASFDQFFMFVTQKQFMADSGISVRRLNALRSRPIHMTLQEMFDISELLNIDSKLFGDLVKKWSTIKQQ